LRFLLSLPFFGVKSQRISRAQAGKLDKNHGAVDYTIVAEHSMGHRWNGIQGKARQANKQTHERGVEKAS
jgi:hypothetical protein